MNLPRQRDAESYLARMLFGQNAETKTSMGFYNRSTLEFILNYRP